MSNSSEQTQSSWLSKIEKPISLLANLATIAGIVGLFIALFQFQQSKKSEKTQNAINAISQTRSSDFLKAYARLKTAHNSNSVKAEDTASLIDDLNFVVNTYDNIALQYINNIADRCVLAIAINSGIKEILPVCDKMSYPKEYKKNIDKLLALMERDHCGQ
jgi:hypothetical protein